MLTQGDQGFSLRVCGATEFQHAYFGEIESSGVDWFSEYQQRTDRHPSIAPLCAIIETEEQVGELKDRIDDARHVGADSITVDAQTYDIQDQARTEKLLDDTFERINNPDIQAFSDESIAPKKLVLNVLENDENLEYGNDDIPKLINDVSYKSQLDFSHLKLQPFPHQEQGIRWLLGLAEPSLNVPDDEDSLHGGLLADDMGLGKTYMALVAINEYYRLCQERQIAQRPVLVVAPLSLLENWRDEIEKYFHKSPFDSTVILQTNADLKKFRIQGAMNELKQTVAAEQDASAIRYALKVGSDYGMDRLDLPRRLVLTTYETLRDYQFSLCKIDWSFVVCDEAQAIKSPNTIATRAAKALKARFRLLATGTPVENHLSDFWCLMDTVKPGALGAYQEFRQNYVVPITKAGAEEIRSIKERVGTELRQRVGALMLRRLKEDNLKGLPAKRHWVGLESLISQKGFGCQPKLVGTMSSVQLKQYDQVIASVQDAQATGSLQGVLLPAMLKLRQISIHSELESETSPNLPATAKATREYLQASVKMKSVLAILDDIAKRQEKVIIFAMSKRLQALLKLSLHRIYGVDIEIINGDTKAVSTNKKNAEMTRKALIAKFEQGSGFGIIVMSPIAAGAGLTVVGANNVIHLERHWNPAKEAQATDRVYRIGQTREVNIYLPMALHPEHSSFDVNLHHLLSNKTTLKDAVVTPEVVSPEMMVNSMW